MTYFVVHVMFTYVVPCTLPCNTMISTINQLKRRFFSRFILNCCQDYDSLPAFYFVSQTPKTLLETGLACECSREVWEGEGVSVP